PELTAVQRRDLQAGNGNPAGDRRRARQQARGGERQRALTAARLADQRHDPAGVDGQARILHRAHRTVADGQVGDFERGRPSGEPRRHAPSLVRGSTNIRSTSATRLKNTTATAPTITVPITIGRSRVCSEFTASSPIPGQMKTTSTVTTPDR